MTNLRLLKNTRIQKQDLTIAEAWSRLKTASNRLESVIADGSVGFRDLTAVRDAMHLFEDERKQPMSQLKPIMKEHFLVTGAWELQRAKSLLLVATRVFSVLEGR